MASPDLPGNEPMAADDLCEHSWSYNKPAHASASVRICSLCHKIDGEDLMRTLNEYAQEYAKLYTPNPVSLMYGHSDGQTVGVVDQVGGLPDSARERALLRALLTFTLQALDERDHPLRLVAVPAGQRTESMS
ncbi:hypothetical protein ACIBAC_11640 [Streptomyces sp. NPDC051362]|uniref:hypothetical protein n=1 Tax=Streptomyces sp. NPDC051362 TaxID=3365651 RepID=UPI0037B8011C